MEHPFLLSPTVLAFLRSLLRAQIPLSRHLPLPLFHQLITPLLGLPCNQPKMLFDLSPPSSSSKMPSSSWSASSTPISSALFAFSVVAYDKIAFFFFFEVVFLLQRSLHRPRHRLYSIIPMIFSSSSSFSSYSKQQSSNIIPFIFELYFNYFRDYSLFSLRVKSNALFHG